MSSIQNFSQYLSQFQLEVSAINQALSDITRVMKGSLSAPEGLLVRKNLLEQLKKCDHFFNEISLQEAFLQGLEEEEQKKVDTLLSQFEAMRAQIKKKMMLKNLNLLEVGTEDLLESKALKSGNIRSSAKAKPSALSRESILPEELSPVSSDFDDDFLSKASSVTAEDSPRSLKSMSSPLSVSAEEMSFKIGRRKSISPFAEVDSEEWEGNDKAMEPRKVEALVSHLL